MKCKKHLRFPVFLLLVMSFLLVFPSLASASYKVITPLPVSFNPKAPASACIDAHILSYDPDNETITMEFLVPEVYDWDDIKSLEAGDVLYTRGREIKIALIEESPWEDGKEIDFDNYTDGITDVQLQNEDDDGDCPWLIADVPYGVFFNMMNEEIVMNKLEPVRVSLRTTQFLDRDEKLYYSDQFVAAFNADPASFREGDIVAVFDAFGNLSLIWRKY